jgi:hypothetical protein
MNDVLVHDGPSGGSSAAPPEAPGRYDWFAIERALDRDGHAILPGLLSRPRCEALAGGYDCNASFRSTIVMARHGFGRGEYKYFRYPLPPVLEVLRHALYPRLAVIANRWNARLGSDTRFPATLAEFLDRCHRAGQTRPTPLILKYGEGDYNCLHQDLYGEHVFPLQVAILLSRPGSDFAGGELVMTETRPGWQRADVVAIGQGDAVAFAVNQRPVTGFQGRTRRVAMRHGVSRVTRGQRHTVGLIFHDAR